VQPGADRRPEVLNTPPLPHCHEILDGGGAVLGDFGDLLQRTAHRNGVLDNLF
jgi:hypothetical protein